MKNFIRALRFAWPYRVRLGISFLCALMAAALWSLNFTAIYPILRIMGTGPDDNLQSWVNASIKKIQDERVAPKEAKMAELKEKKRWAEDLPSGPRKRLKDAMPN